MALKNDHNSELYTLIRKSPLILRPCEKCFSNLVRAPSVLFNLSLTIHLAQIPDGTFQSCLDSIYILSYTWILLMKHIYRDKKWFSQQFNSLRFFNVCHDSFLSNNVNGLYVCFQSICS